LGIGKEVKRGKKKGDVMLSSFLFHSLSLKFGKEVKGEKKMT
jgi:hypothetical protein